MKQPEYSSIARRFESLNNIFYLMVGIPLLLFGWIYLNIKLISPWGLFDGSFSGTVIHILILFIAAFMAYRAYRKYKSRLSAPDINRGANADKEQVLAKANYFLSVSREFYGILTISTLLIVIGFYLSVEGVYVGAYTILLVMYSIYRPTLDRMIKEMKLNKEDQELLFEAWKNPGS